MRVYIVHLMADQVLALEALNALDAKQQAAELTGFSGLMIRRPFPNESFLLGAITRSDNALVCDLIK